MQPDRARSDPQRRPQAVIDMLLPLAAVAFGLTAIGIIFLPCARTPP